MFATDRIPTPWNHRWHRIRRGWLPVGCFVLCAGLVAWLWGRQGRLPHAVGEVEAVRLVVPAGSDGVLSPLSHGTWTLFDTVDSGQVLARLDDRAVMGRLATLQEELVRLRKELEAATANFAQDEADRQRTHLVDADRLRYELEQRRLAVMDRRVQLEVTRLELQRCDERLETMKPLYARKMISELELTNEQAQREITARRSEEGGKALREAETHWQEAEARCKGCPEFRAAEAAKVLAPIAAAVEVQQARIRELDVEIERLVVHAPIRGTICAIHRWPGESVRAGDPLVTIAADQGRYIMTYVRQEQRLHPVAGMAVDIRVRAPASPILTAVVETVGPQVEPVPPHQCRDPKVQEWGLPVRVAIPSGLSVKPGELVDIRLRPGLVPLGAAASP